MKRRDFIKASASLLAISALPIPLPNSASGIRKFTVFALAVVSLDQEFVIFPEDEPSKYIETRISIHPSLIESFDQIGVLKNTISDAYSIRKENIEIEEIVFPSAINDLRFYQNS